MSKTHLKRLSISLISIGLIFTIRILWFLDANRLTTNLWMGLIFVVSMGVLAMVIYHIKRHIAWVAPQFIYIGTLLVLDILFLLKNQIPLSFVYVFSTSFAATLLYLLSVRLTPKSRRIIDLTILVFFGIYVIGQDVYYRIFNDLFSFKEAVTAREGLESSESMYQLEFFHVIVVVLVATAFYFYLKESRKIVITISKMQFRKLCTLPLLLLIFITFNMHYNAAYYKVYQSDPYLYKTVFNKTTFASKFGLLNLIPRDTVDALTPTFYTESDVKFVENRLSEQLVTHESNRFTEIFKDKNLIFILAESFDEIALSETLTPNLYKLKQEGLDFQNHYTPVFQRTTSDSEFIFNTSLIPSIEDGPTSYMFHDNSYTTSMAYLFTQKGYETAALHSNYKEFYTRDKTYPGFGYQHFYGQHELNIPENDKRFDTRFYDYAQDIMVPLTGKFMRFVITFSGHSPYDFNHPVVHQHIETVRAHITDDIPESIVSYMATQVELDLMLGKLLDDLQLKGRLNDTVILLTSDHYPYTLNQADYVSLKDFQHDYEKHQGNLYIWTPGITAETIQLLSSSFDILPMLINMFGLEGDYNHYIGRDIFGSPSNLIYFKNYAFFDGTSYVLLSNRYDPIASSVLKQAYEDYRYSRIVLRSNYFNRTD